MPDSQPLVLWPTPTQTLLLRAALSEGEAARGAFAAWRGEVDFTALDSGSSRLLPLLYANLKKQGVDAPELALLKAFYLQSWGNSRRHLEAAARVIGALAAEGVPAVMLKGVALGLAYYGDIALRPMSDLDMAVAPENRSAAIDALLRAGWRLKEPQELRDIGFYYSATLAEADGAELDLHWCMLAETCNADADRHFREDLEPLSVNDMATQRLNATDTLFCTVIHGMRANTLPPLRWIADAVTILRCAHIDWEAMITFARQQNLTHRLGLGLSYLAADFDVPIPTDVLARLSGPPATFIERLESKVYVTDHSAPSQRFRTLRLFYAQYERTHRDTPRGAFYLGAVHFLRHHLDNHPIEGEAMEFRRGVLNALAAIVPAPLWAREPHA